MRALYSLAWWLAVPLVLVRLWWRGRQEPGCRQHIAERFGLVARSACGQCCCAPAPVPAKKN